MGPIAKELEQHLWMVAGGWVRGVPNEIGQACLLYRNKGKMDSIETIPWDTRKFLSDFANDYVREEEYPAGVIEWNDALKRTKEEVIWLVEEALDEAIEMGV